MSKLWAKLILRFQCLGRHRWRRVSTLGDGLGSLDQCHRCGQGRATHKLGRETFVFKKSAAKMQEIQQRRKNED